MRIRRLAIAGVALAAAIGLSGCGTDKDAPSGAGTATGPAAEQAAQPADPATELAAAATKLGEDSVKVRTSMAAGLNAEGAVDKAGDKMDMTMTLGEGDKGMKVAMRKVGADIYMKFDGALGSMLGARTGKWMHIDAAKVPAGSAFSMENNDPKSAAKLIAAASQVRKTGDRSYQGVLDMTKGPNANADLQKLGAKAQAVPFTAEADDQGRLVKLVIDVAAIAPTAGKMTTEYYDFGSPVSVQAPPSSQVVEMPKEMLGLVNA